MLIPDNVIDPVSGSERAETSIAVCADDFGLSPMINEGILNLARARRLTGIGILIDAHLPPKQHGQLIRLAESQVDIGLHLNLTEKLPGSRTTRSLREIVVQVCLRRLDGWTIRDEIHRQLSRFERRIGKTPDYIDGHQHVHILPIVRESLIQVLKERYPTKPPWVRCCRSPDQRLPLTVANAKSIVLDRLDRSRADSSFGDAGLARNRSLLGVYRFPVSNRDGHYEALLEQWLRHARNADLLMVHPSTQAAQADPVGFGRIAEYVCLASSAFPDALGRNRIRMHRMSRILSSAIPDRH